MRNPLPPVSVSDETSPTVARSHGIARPLQSTLPALRKVPEITVYFWIIKLLTTAMGESLSDFLLIHFGLVGIVVGVISLTASLVLQFSVRRYVPWIYWSAISMVAIVGTMLADIPHGLLGVPFLVTTGACAVALAAIFAVWYARERTLSIHHIDTRRREGFYWATVMAAFALGTAAGDLIASIPGLGYFLAAVLFTAIITIPILGYRFFSFNEILAFWFAYIVTRPIGASFADWLGRPSDLSGLGLGAGRVGLAFAIATVGFVAYVTVTHKDRMGTYEPASASRA